MKSRVQTRKLRARPQRVRMYALSRLLKNVTRQNLHREIRTGIAVGHEVW